jgi:pimeloyl-ACP methyl ester carboxylesterase
MPTVQTPKKSPCLVLAFLWLCLGIATESCAQVPLPHDIVLTPPSANVPADIAIFAGAWGGDGWSGTLPHVLVVEQVKSDGTAEAVYAWGNNRNGTVKAGWSRDSGLISNGKLHFDFPNGAVVDYTVSKDGTLFGRYVFRKTPSYVCLTRIAGHDATTIIAAAAKPVPLLWEEISIPEHSKVGETAGKTLALQAILFRTPLTGHRPVIIFNHGSTGGGIMPANMFPSFARRNNAARTFLALGYTVVLPMRKGFGKSDGPMIEEQPSSTTTQDVQLNSAVEDLDAVVKYMETQPYVDPAHIVVGGQSRGGMLAVAYAGRYPDKVAGVINFSGGWWGERAPTADFNLLQFGQAGRTASIPMLWLYADHDTLYSLAYIERGFATFRAAGGNGQLFEVSDLPGNGHLLVSWPDKWQNVATAYLKNLEKSAEPAGH